MTEIEDYAFYRLQKDGRSQNPMVRRHGRAPDFNAQCGSCHHLQRGIGSHRRKRCQLMTKAEFRYRPKDHPARWYACGLFRPREEKA